MRRIVVFPPGCSRCGSSRLVFLEYMSQSHPEDWFRCDACGHFITLLRPFALPPRQTRRAPYLLAAVAFATLALLARRAASQAKARTDGFARSLIEAAHERPRVAFGQ